MAIQKLFSKILLIQTYHTTCVSFSCEFSRTQTISLFIGCIVESRNYSILSLAFIASSFRVTEENLVFKTVHSCPYSSFKCFLCSLTLWNNSLISISILRDYWLETMRDGNKCFLIYLDTCMGVI